MPTRRTFVLIILALGLYFIANQTQVGWVYIMTNALIGLVLVSFIFSLGMLKSIRGTRTFHNLSTHLSVSSLPSQNKAHNRPIGNSQSNTEILTLPNFYEDNPIDITLQLRNVGLNPAFLVSGQETCLFAPPAEQIQPFFAPSLFKNQVVNFKYQTTCDRRGLYTFATIPLRSKGPFNLFGTRRTLSVPGQILIYPKYHPLKRMRLLENRGFADKKVMRVGASNEVIGTREYRSGDSLRKIHWRSTARLGKLVVKEFSDDDQLTMTVALDLSTQGNLGEGKFSTFETAVRLAASLGHYATGQNIPFYLAGYSQRWMPPTIALSWSGALNYLAKVDNDGQKSLAQILHNLPPLPFVVALISNPNEAIIQELELLQRKGTQTLAIFITPDGNMPFPALGKRRAGIEIKTVDPHSWPAMLDKL